MVNGAMPAVGASQRLDVEYLQRRRKLRARWNKVVIYSGRTLVVLLFFVGWQAFASASGHGAVAVPSPDSTWEYIQGFAANGALWHDLEATALEIGVGYLCGAIAGILVGGVLSASRSAARIVDPLIIALWAVPKIAFAPLFILVFGIGFAPKFVLTAVLVFFVVFYTTFEGIRDIDPALKVSLRMLSASRAQTIMYLVMPSALRTILLGLKLAVPQAVTGAIIGEFMVSNRGLGYEVLFSASQFDMAGVFGALALITTIAIVLNLLVSRVGLREPDRK